MQYVIGTIAFIIILGAIVLIHEMGHFFMAKRAKILCYEFSIGMGPLIWKKKKGETVYSLRAIPIGGYVSMAGEEVESDLLKGVKKVKLEWDNENRITKIICDPEHPKYQDLPEYNVTAYNLLGTLEKLPDELYIEVFLEGQESEHWIVNRDCTIIFNRKQEMQISPIDRNFSSKKLGQRFLTIFGGPFMNFVFALFLFFLIGVIQGYPNENGTTVDTIYEGAPVYGVLEKNDTLLEIGGYKVEKWEDISEVMTKFALGQETFNGKITIKYYDESEKVEKTAEIIPITSVYSIELMLNNENVEVINQVVVGEYSQNNNKTKAYLAGLRKGDIITYVKTEDGSFGTKIENRNDLLRFFTDEKLDEATKVTVTYVRDGVEQTATVETYSKKMLSSQNIPQTKMQLGVSPEYSFQFGKLMYMPWVETGSSCLGIFKTLGLLFTDSSVHIDDFSGPVGIFQLITSTASSGFVSLLSLTAFLSVNIGFVNLLPIPALDGGRLAFILYEAITKKKPNPKVENIIHSIGFLLLMGLFVFISFSDIMRIFGCK